MDEKCIRLSYLIFVTIYTSIYNGQAVDFPSNKDKENHGHRQVENNDEIKYKKIPTYQIMGSIQLGIQNTMKNDCNLSEPDRDLLMPDFVKIEAVVYPKRGTQHTPSHEFQEFTFKTYAPIIFHRFRHFYGINPNEYTESICSFPLHELSDSGTSGTLFYITQDDKFILKIVHLNESKTLQDLLYAYYLNLKENPKTLLPKFFGLYRYQTNLIDMSMHYPSNKIQNIRFVIMNNILPSNIKIHEKYDLKGSTYKRKASKKELQKSSPTFKDLDFKKNHPDRIYLKADTYETLFNVLQNDCKVLESINVKDYRLLLGVHYVDRVENKGENQSEAQLPNAVEKRDLSLRSIDALSGSGERLLLFVGIINVLHSYDSKKRADQDFNDANKASFYRSNNYASRFLDFMAKKVFKMYEDSSNQSSLELEEASLYQQISSEEDISVEIKVDHQSKQNKREVERKRFDNEDENINEEIYSNQITVSIQLGIKHALENLFFETDQNLLVTDFGINLTIFFPCSGFDCTSRNHFPKFTFTSYGPIIFHRIRSVYKIKPEEYIKSICSLPLHELSNPGASGSIFYRTEDDKYFIKTVQEQESKFLQKLLLGYYLNLDQNENTLLPKLFGHYRYRINLNNCLSIFNPMKKKRNMILLVMNNLLPSNIEIKEKYDLKGSTFQRKASESERLKRKPTFKDLDFLERHPHGFYLDQDAYSILMKTLKSDCKVLESFEIMDYSLLIGVHYVNHNQETEKDPIVQGPHNEEREGLYKQGIPAKSGDGKDLLLFVGIIDILQDYRMKKKIEHMAKSVIDDGNTISVHRPDVYANRFLVFMDKYVFKKKLSSWNGRKTFGEFLREKLD